MSDLDKNFNHSRYILADDKGFYESYFQRANHPSRPLAFWIRYTVFVPRAKPSDAIGELWAVWFDGEKGRTVVAKTELPMGRFDFSRERLAVRIGDARLEAGKEPGTGTLKGDAASRDHRIEWDLSFDGKEPPLWLLPPELYDTPLPKAKSLVGVPMARYRGSLGVDGERIEITDWVGSQNHNWGAKHTDRYAYGQVAGFDNAPASFLEVATGQLKIGPIWTPRMTPLVLRHKGREFALRDVKQAVLKARGRFEYFNWEFSSRSPEVRIEGRITAPKEAFVGLRYYNPPGGEKYCLNSKIASCRLLLRYPDRTEDLLETRHRAAFEILTDDLEHGVEIRT